MIKHIHPMQLKIPLDEYRKFRVVAAMNDTSPTQLVRDYIRTVTKDIKIELAEDLETAQRKAIKKQQEGV